MDLNEIKKDLFKSKVNAKLTHYISGNLYYTVELSDGKYQFPIPTVEECESGKDYNLSSDLGTTKFNIEMKGSDLNRWIAKAVSRGEFIRVS